jgi:hypothetical protein
MLVCLGAGSTSHAHAVQRGPKALLALQVRANICMMYASYITHIDANFTRNIWDMIFSGRLGRWRKLPIHRSISDQSEVCRSIFICKHVLLVDSTCYYFDLVSWHNLKRNLKCFHMLKKSIFFIQLIWKILSCLQISELDQNLKEAYTTESTCIGQVVHFTCHALWLWCMMMPAIAIAWLQMCTKSLHACNIVTVYDWYLNDNKSLVRVPLQ